MKKLLLILLIIPVIVLCGFKKAVKPFVVLSSGSITKENTTRIERVFSVGQRVNYCLIAPDGVKYSGIRMQLSTQDEKTSNWGFSIIESNDVYVPQSDMEYCSYFVPRKSGHYIIQFFYLNNKRYPFVHKEFLVR